MVSMILFLLVINLFTCDAIYCRGYGPPASPGRADGEPLPLPLVDPLRPVVPVVDVAVIVPLDSWKRVKSGARPSLPNRIKYWCVVKRRRRRSLKLRSPVGILANEDNFSFTK